MKTFTVYLADRDPSPLDSDEKGTAVVFFDAQFAAVRAGELALFSRCGPSVDLVAAFAPGSWLRFTSADVPAQE
jgi:hypothetical protein